MQVKSALSYLEKELSKIEEPYLAKREALSILAHLLSTSLLNVYLYKEKEVSEEEIHRILAERLTFKPLPYILKKTFFYGREFFIEEGVLIPRPETEILISTFLETNLKEGWFLELGCGSGVISITLLLECPKLKVMATDISEKSFLVTKINAKKHKVEERLFLVKGNWFKPFKERAFFSAIVSNPPYLSLKEWKTLSREVKDFEPPLALIGGIKGTEFQEELLKKGPFLLKEGGFLIFEIGYDQRKKLEELIRKYGYYFEIKKDFLNIDRVVKVWRV